MFVRLLHRIILMALMLPAAAMAHQSFLAKLLNKAVSSAAQSTTSPSTTTTLPGSDGVHASGPGYNQWAYPKFVPAVLDGYTHIRFGTAAVDPFGNAVNGRPTCDPEFMGYALLHRTALTPDDARICLSWERNNDPAATVDTLRRRMATIAGTRKFYIRGTVNLYVRSGPNGEPIPPGSVLVVWGNHLMPVSGPSGTWFTMTGPNWFGPWSNTGDVDAFKLLTQMDLTGRDIGPLGSKSYVFFTIGAPVNDGMSPVQRNLHLYHVVVTVDKIVLEDNRFQNTILPAASAIPFKK